MIVSNYQNFDLEFHKTAAGYKVKARSLAGEATHSLTLPFTLAEAQRFIIELENDIAQNMIASESVKAWGGNLFEAIFANDIRAVYKSSLDLINAQGGSGLRIRLHLQDVVELSHLPWEFLYQAAANQFLCHSRQTPIVRYIEIPKVIAPLAVTLPVRLLVMISSPTNLPQLVVEHEKAKIQTALAALIEKQLVDITFLEAATVAELQKNMRQGNFHIFHFIGHGDFDEAANQGVLAFENEDETADYVKAEQLSAILGNHPSLRLAVLNSCKGSRTSLANPFADTATTLVQQGIPAVIAMQFSISDTAAVKFAGEFYAAIADGLPVDMAVTEARVGIFSGEDHLEWGTPVLFMRSDDGALFEIGGAAEEIEDRKKKKPSRVALAIYIFLTLGFGLLTFVILGVLPKSTLIEMEVFDKQVNFALPPESRSGQQFSLLHSGFWTPKVSVEKFQALEIMAVSLSSPKQNLAFVNPLTVYPEPRNGRATFASPPADISLQEVICDSGSHVSIARDEGSIAFQIRESSQPPQLMLSLGENVDLMIQACRVVDGAQHDLTSLFEDTIAVRLHDMSRALVVQGQEGELRMVADSVASPEDEPAQFILAGLVQNLDFFKDVYELGGVMKRSTIDSVAIKQNQLLDAASFKSHEAGDLEITATPNRFAIYDLMESGNGLKVRAQGRLKSLQVGRGALQSELVPRYLSFIAHYPAVSVAMTWGGWFLTVVLPILLQAKLGQKNDSK